MKKFLATLLVALSAIGMVYALPEDLEWGMNELDLINAGVRFERTSIEAFPAISSYKINEPELETRTMSLTTAYASAADGILVITEDMKCPEASWQRRYDYYARQLSKEYGTPMDLDEWIAEHPFNEDILFIALLGGIDDEDLLEETVLSAIADYARNEGLEDLLIYRGKEHEFVSLVPMGSERMKIVYVSGDALISISRIIREDVGANIAKRFGDIFDK